MQIYSGVDQHFANTFSFAICGYQTHLTLISISLHPPSTTEEKYMSYFFKFLTMTGAVETKLYYGAYRIPLNYLLHINKYTHRVYEVPGFLSSRPHWLPPPFTPQRVLSSLSLVPRGETHSLGERGRGGGGEGGNQFGRRDRLCGTLGIV